MTPEQITKLIIDQLFYNNCINWDETDCYGITAKQSLIPYVTPFISAYAEVASSDGTSINRSLKFLSVTNLDRRTVTSKLIYVKMLNVFADGGKYSYMDCWEKILKPQGKTKGYNTDTFRGLIFDKFITFVEKGQRNKLLYSITPLGRLILETAKANEPANRVMQHFLGKKNKDPIAKMMQDDLLGLETYKDVMPNAIIDMLKSVFDSDGSIRKIGSHIYWINRIVTSYRTIPYFREIFNNDDVQMYLDKQKELNKEFAKFVISLKKTDLKIH